MAFETELRIATLAVQRASRITTALSPSTRSSASLLKDASSPITTAADFAAQASLIAALHAAFPHDTFIAEESSQQLRSAPALIEHIWTLLTTTRISDPAAASLALPKDREDMLRIIDMGASRGGPGRTWIMDPIDGTEAFVRGGQYAVCLALVEDGVQRLAVLGCPNMALDQGPISETTLPREGESGWLLSAVQGEGAWMQRLTWDVLEPRVPIPLRKEVGDIAGLKTVDAFASPTMDTGAHERVNELLGIKARATNLWSLQMKYVAVAVGGHDVMVRIPTYAGHRTAVWDHAGGQLLVEETGYRVTDVFGKCIDFSRGRRCSANLGNVVAPVEVHARVLEAVKNVHGFGEGVDGEGYPFERA
ncbi:carbohydrate phosphatase [Trichodelitschia bisporula]|uniref:Carbohydrate phosphatase n=1 Tax=Trichodelitschia bisporula TaxID=703511 RepID=A0A6G1IAJ5_9PEZI|nr:carbohydrate phosphatase [Trichodelitschia bisporula]